MSINSGITNSSCSSRNNCQKAYKNQIKNLLNEYNKNKPNSKVTSLNDAITELRTTYKNNSFSDKFITVDPGTIVKEDDKYIYQCSIDFTKLFNILRFTGKSKSGYNLDNQTAEVTIEGKPARERTLGSKIVDGVKIAIKDKLKPSNSNKNILKMDNIYWGKDEGNLNKLYMNMNIKKFYDEVLINKKVLPKIRLSKKSIIDKLIHPNTLKAKAFLGSKPNIARYVKNEKGSYNK